MITRISQGGTSYNFRICNRLFFPELGTRPSKLKLRVTGDEKIEFLCSALV